MNKDQRLHEEKYNNQGSKMKIIEYIRANNIVVKFLDEYGFEKRSTYREFKNGEIKNPYHPSVCGVGMLGIKYPTNNKECRVWRGILKRCYDKKYKDDRPTYDDVICCKEWTNFENFYEWLHSQENFDYWQNSNRYTIDKDILVKHNKLYSPETCCIVPHNVNCLFIREESIRGELPIGVYRRKNKFGACCASPFTNKNKCLGSYNSIEEAFNAYKEYKESMIKQVANIEYANGAITERCYNAMMNYTVEITD